MSVADLAAKAQAPHRACQVCHALANLTDAKAATLNDLLSNPEVRYLELAKELATDPKWKLVLDDKALSRHARAVGAVHRGMSPMR